MNINYYFEQPDVSFEDLIGLPDLTVDSVIAPSVGESIVYGNKIYLVLERWWMVFEPDESKNSLQECEVLLRDKREI